MVRWASHTFRDAALAESILRRAASLAYSAVSLFVMLGAFTLVMELEFTGRAAQCWKNNRLWAAIEPGMDRAEVVRMLGAPNDIHYETFYFYDLHPFNHVSSDFVEFDEQGKVKSKRPSGEEISREWLPPGFDHALRDFAKGFSVVASVIGIVVLLAASLLPVGMGRGWAALPLYYPLFALLLVAAYEWPQTGGWRFDRLLLVPVYLVVLIAWAFRVYAMLRLR